MTGARSGYLLDIAAALIIVIVVAAIIVVAVIVSMLIRRSAEREIEHDRLSGEAFAHRDQAEANISRARRAFRDAELHRDQASEHAVLAEEHAAKAEEHAEKAAELERSVRTAGEAAAFHDAQAAEREQQVS